MKPLSPVDQLFLWLEQRQQPMHVGGLQLFSFPEGAPDDYVARLAESLREYRQVSPPFNQRLSRRFTQPVWVPDDELDLEHHFRLKALPTPGRVRELLSFVSSEHSHLMDRERPLWECHLIEGLEERRFALYTKVHHSLVDGVSAMRKAQRMLSADPDERDMPPVWALQPKSTGSQEDNSSTLWNSVARLLERSGKQLGTVPTVAKELLRTINEARHHPDYDSIFHAPRCVLNNRISGSRRFAAQSYSLTRIRHVCEATGTTINDVVMAMCATALRRYLLDQGELPAKPLIAMVPVNLRRDNSEGGNQVGILLASLFTHLDDPAERLMGIHEDVKRQKERYRAMSAEEVINYTALTLAPAAFQLLTGMAPKWQTFNVVISNVPGPKETLYWNGARLEGMYPVSIAMDRLGLNMTLATYGDQVEFGLTGCRRTLPSLQRMLAHLETGLVELERAC